MGLSQVFIQSWERTEVPLNKLKRTVRTEMQLPCDDFAIT